MPDDNGGYHVVAEMLQELGYRARYNSEDGFLESAMCGLQVLVYYFEQGSIQFFCGLRLPDSATFGPERVNEFNRNYRFSKVYLMDENGLGLEQDFIFDPTRDTARDDLRRIVAVWEGSVSIWKEELAKQPTRTDQGAATGSVAA